jgi:hypothetical protein
VAALALVSTFAAFVNSSLGEKHYLRRTRNFAGVFAIGRSLFTVMIAENIGDMLGRVQGVERVLHSDRALATCTRLALAGFHGKINDVFDISPFFVFHSTVALGNLHQVLEANDVQKFSFCGITLRHGLHQDLEELSHVLLCCLIHP